MKLSKIINNEKFVLANKVKVDKVNITEFYACDLLSIAMANAKKKNAFLTVIANINTLAVVSLLDLSCVILTHDVRPSEEFISKANSEGIPIITTKLNTIEAIRIIDNL